MKLEFYSTEKLKKEIKRIFSKYISLKEYKIFFFGSRVRGDSFLTSDIDIGIIGKKPLSPAMMFKVKEELERLPLLYDFDVIDFSDVSEDFRKKAMKRIEYVD